MVLSELGIIQLHIDAVTPVNDFQNVTIRYGSCAEISLCVELHGTGSPFNLYVLELAH